MTHFKVRFTHSNDATFDIWRSRAEAAANLIAPLLAIVHPELPPLQALAFYTLPNRYVEILLRKKDFPLRQGAFDLFERELFEKVLLSAEPKLNRLSDWLALYPNLSPQDAIAAVFMAQEYRSHVHLLTLSVNQMTQYLNKGEMEWRTEQNIKQEHFND